MDQGRTFLGIELGSTRIKAVVIDETYRPVAVGSHTWENQMQDGVWTYGLDLVWAGLQDCVRQLITKYREQYAAPLPRIDAMGVSAMMHGYLVFDQAGRQLAPFRTWRNTMTQEAAGCLTQLFEYNIPQRWSIAHLYQAILREEPHVAEIRYMTTLAGYVHWKLTGQKVLGVGEASGMFPIDSQTGAYNRHMMDQFQMQIAHKKYPWTLAQILPAVLQAGEPAGRLTEEGAKLLDPTGEALQAGIALCPPEGDAGTGMVATNSVAKRTGNVSAGTSVFAMVVLEHPLSKVYPEIDMVTTPTGRPAAMVHCNNCTSDLDAWVRLFSELLETAGAAADRPALYD
ncbi:MAG: ATPase, partial [Clostridiales bacterium]|nr:ATPase [Clostridiales bacterium]